MAVTRVNATWQLTAAADAITQPIKLQGLSFSGTGLTVGQHLIIKDKNGGAILWDHYVTAAQEDVVAPPLWSNPFWVAGIYLDTVPAAGTWVVTVVGA